MKALMLLILLAGAAPAAADADIEQLVLAEVNGETITVERLVEDFRSRHGGHLSLLVGQDVMQSFLDAQVEDRLLVQEGRRLELDRDPRVVEEMLRRERKLRTAALIEEKVSSRVQVSDEEVERARRKLTTVHSIRWLLVPTRALAEEGRRRLAGGEAFAEVAPDLSIDASARTGGDPGPFVWGGQSLELERQVERLPVGELSQVFAVGDNFAVVQVVDREELEEPPTGRRVERKVRDILGRRQEEALLGEFLESLRKKRKVRLHDELLSLDRLRAAARGEGEDAPVASIGKRQIGLFQLAGQLEFEEWAEMAPPRFRRQVRRDLQRMIDSMLLDEEGRRRGSGGPAVDLELRAAEDRAILRILLAELVYGELEPTDEQLRELYRSQPDRFRSPDRFHLYHLVVADEALAGELRAQLQGQGQEAFSEAARQHSLDGDSAPYGGDLGWMRIDRMMDDMRALLEGLEPGELSEVVRTPVGFVLIRMADMAEGKLPELERVREDVRRAWIADAQRAARTAWLDRLRSLAEVRVDAEAVARAAEVMTRRADERYSGAGPMHGPGTEGR